MSVRAKRATLRRSAWSALAALGLVAAASPKSAETAETAETAPKVEAPVSIEITARHIVLEASVPEDEARVEDEVTEVRLYFSDAPIMRGASIRIVNSSRQLMRSRPPRADEDDPKQLSVQIPQSLTEGTYVVQWRCIADDGHVMRGDFTFEVATR